MSIEITRRSVSIAVGAGILLPEMALQASAQLPFLAWWRAFSAGAAAGWLTEALKNFNLIPGAQASINPKVQQDHSAEQNKRVAEGYGVNNLYTGRYATGDVAISSGRSGNDASSFVGLVTSNHLVQGRQDRSTCTLVHYAPDLYALRQITNQLRDAKVSNAVIQKSVLPVHSDVAYNMNNYSGGGHNDWREAMTPNGGMIRWRADIETPGNRPTVLAEIESRDLNTKGNTLNFS